VHSGASYCSQSDLALSFGLAGDRTIKSLSVDWPSGAHQRFNSIAANQFLTIDESRGIIK
jgi:enediyne biosynthesis protein E4